MKKGVFVIIVFLLESGLATAQWAARPQPNQTYPTQGYAPIYPWQLKYGYTPTYSFQMMPCSQQPYLTWRGCTCSGMEGQVPIYAPPPMPEVWPGYGSINASQAFLPPAMRPLSLGNGDLVPGKPLLIEEEEKKPSGERMPLPKGTKPSGERMPLPKKKPVEQN
jgi:hypothetical protein